MTLYLYISYNCRYNGRAADAIEAVARMENVWTKSVKWNCTMSINKFVINHGSLIFQNVSINIYITYLYIFAVSDYKNRHAIFRSQSSLCWFCYIIFCLCFTLVCLYKITFARKGFRLRFERVYFLKVSKTYQRFIWQNVLWIDWMKSDLRRWPLNMSASPHFKLLIKIARWEFGIGRVWENTKVQSNVSKKKKKKNHHRQKNTHTHKHNFIREVENYRNCVYS